MDDANTTAETDKPSASSFPGGRVRLPRLSPRDRSADTQIDVVGTAFVTRAAKGLAAVEEPRGGFTEYFTYESLFEDPPEGQGDPGAAPDPYKVLRVSSDATWTTIVHAHRHLAKQFHPDRFAEHPPEIQAQADVEIKRINVAYATLRRIHPGAR